MSITVYNADGAVDVPDNDATLTEDSIEDTEVEPGELDESESDEDEIDAEESDPEDDETEDDESEDADEDDSEDDSEENEEDEESEDEDEGEDDKPKRRSGFKKRIDKLNRRISDRDNVISDVKLENEDLKRRLEALEQGKPTEKNNDDPSANTPDQTAIAGKHGLKEPNLDDYEDYGQYMRDLTKYEIKLERAVDQENSQKSQYEQEFKAKVTKFQARAKEIATTTKDFDKVIKRVDHIRPNSDLQLAILESENGAELMYALAKDPEKYEKINGMGQAQINRELGRLEAKIELSKSSDKDLIGKKKVKRKSTAAKPLKKVGTKGKGTARSLYDTDLSQAEFERLRAESAKNR